MSVGCHEFISAAERFLVSENSEIAWRIAAGRAYYGAFHCCRDLVSRQPSISLNQYLGEHERYYQAVNALPHSYPGAADLKRIVYRAQQIRAIRITADYEIHKGFDRIQAEQAIQAAKKVHDLHQQFVATYKLT